jgi:hypothetical protein
MHHRFFLTRRLYPVVRLSGYSPLLLLVDTQQLLLLQYKLSGAIPIKRTEPVLAILQKPRGKVANDIDWKAPNDGCLAFERGMGDHRRQENRVR